MIDVTHQISAVDRRVGTRVLAAGEARTVEVSQVYDATVDEMWDACTNAERIPRWFLPVSGDLKEGGHYKLEGNAEGTIERCDPPHGFDATWEFGGQLTWIEVRFSAEGDARTRFALTHIAHVDDGLWAQFGPGAVGIGWDLALIGLALHLGSGASVDPAEVAAWNASDEGRLFTRRSGEAWRDAHVASGVDPADAAEAAAARTIAAYTESPEGDALPTGEEG
jgi:uncharacterized protein YndB with AHSA1/START domain